MSQCWILSSTGHRQDNVHTGSSSKQLLVQGAFSYPLKTHLISSECFEEITWNKGDMDVGESNVTHSTRKKPCCCSGAAASLSSSGKNLVKFANKSSSSHGNAFPERPTNVSTECTSSSYSNEAINHFYLKNMFLMKIVFLKLL